MAEERQELQLTNDRLKRLEEKVDVIGSYVVVLANAFAYVLAIAVGLLRPPSPRARLCDEICETSCIVVKRLVQFSDRGGEIRSRLRCHQAVAAAQYTGRNALRQFGHQCARQLKSTGRRRLLRELNYAHRLSPCR
jgi:hypothetical protein